MSDFPDSIGTMAEGAALARAVEPNSGARARGGAGHFDESHCLNCGTALSGNYCAHCGQAAHLHRTLGAFLHDLLHGVLHFEGKTWRTLPMLAFRPGQLTRDYIEGKRARFVSPMGLFLFSVFTMFAVFSIMGIATPATPGQPALDTEQIAPAVAELEKQERDLAVRLETAVPGSAEQADMADTLSGVRATGKTLRMAQGEGEGWKSGWTRLDNGVAKWRANPGLMLYKMQANSYKFSWLVIPLSLPFMWLLFFWKRGIGMYDHTVFVTYSIAFMSLLFIVGSVMVGLGAPEPLIVLAMTLIPLVHIFVQLKGAYRLSAVSALWRTGVLIGFIGIVAVLFMATIIVLGTLG